MDAINKTLNRLAPFAIALLAAAGVAAVIYATRWGAALSDDSYAYIHAARGFIAGQWDAIIMHWPPLLSLLLAVPGALGIDPLVSVRWLNALLFGATIVLGATLTWRMTRSKLAALACALVLLISTNLIEAYAWAMSEPLFITLVLLGWLFFIHHGGNLRSEDAVVLGLCFGLSAVTRYIGIGAVIAGALALGLHGLRQPRASWWARMLSYAAGAAAPLAAWVGWVLLADVGTTTTRALAWHPPSAQLIIEGLNTALLWLLPGRLVHGRELIWLAVVLVGGAAAAVLVARYMRRGLRLDDAGLRLGGWLAVCYLLTLLASRTWLDISIPFDSRLLVPLWALLVVLLVALIARVASYPTRYVVLAGFALLALVLFTNGIRSYSTLRSYHEQGRGYASARNHISETYAYLRRTPEKRVYSNAWAGVYFWTDNPAVTIPESSKLDVMKADMCASGAYLVVFNSIPLSLYHVSEEELLRGLEPVIELSEATIYRVSQAAGKTFSPAPCR